MAVFQQKGIRLVILKVSADISNSLDVEPANAESNETWWKMRPVYEAALTDDWAFLLLASSDWDSYAELYPFTAKAQYVRLLWFLGGLIFLCVILPPVLIRYPLDIGVPGITAQLLRAPRKVAMAKILVFFLTVLVLSLLSTLLQISTYAGSIVSQAGFGCVLYTVLLRLLMDMAVLSIPMYLAFCIRSMPALIMLNTAYGCLCYGLNVLASRLETVVPVPIPAFLHGLQSLWQPGGPAGWIIFAILISLGYIILFSTLSIRRLKCINED